MRRLEADIHQFRNSPSRWTPAVSSDPAATVGYADTTYFSETGLSPATQYWFRVVSTDGSNHYSIASNVVISVTGPSISISASTGDSENTATTLTTSVTVAAGEVDPETSWSINWGDGDTQTYTGSATLTGNTFTSNIPHTYTTPGQYTIIASTTDGLFTGTAETTVTDAIGTVSLVNDSGNDYLAGDTFGVTASYNGNPVNQWVVDWGDGSNSVTSSSGGTNSATDLTHTYADSYGDSTATPATGFNVTVSAETNDGVYASSEVVTISPNGSSSVYTPPTELNSAPVVSAPVELVANVGDSVTFYAGVTGLSLSPSADPIAFVDWGNDGISQQATINVQSGNPSDGVVVATLGSAPAGGLTPKFTVYEPGNASEDVSDKSQVLGTLDAPSAYIDQGESNDLLMVGGALQQVVFNFPGVPGTETPVLTVNASSSTGLAEDELWNTPTPTTGATPLLGGTGPSTYVDNSLTAGQTSATFWVQALVGDTATNVDSYEATTTYDAAYYDLSSAMGEALAGYVPEAEMVATPVSMATQPISNGALEIDAQPSGTKVSDGTVRNVMVGSNIDLLAKFVAPASFVGNGKFSWSVAGNVLSNWTWQTATESYHDAVQGGKVQSFVVNQALAKTTAAAAKTPPPSVGQQQSEIQFYWVTTTAGAASENDNVTVSVVNAAGHSLGDPVTAQFQVFEPVLAGSPADTMVAPTLNTATGAMGLGTATTPGIIFNSLLNNPTAVMSPLFAPAAPKYALLQLMNPRFLFAQHHRLSLSSNYSAVIFFNRWQLDGDFPNTDSAELGAISTNVSPPSPRYDSPGNFGALDPNAFDFVFEAFEAKTYLMYTPGGNTGHWVPADLSDWSYAEWERTYGIFSYSWIPGPTPTYTSTPFTAFSGGEPLWKFQKPLAEGGQIPGSQYEELNANLIDKITNGAEEMAQGE